MESIDFNSILREVAKQYGTTTDQVKAGIEEVIDECWNSPDPEIHAKWAAMSPAGQRPSVEEVLLYLSAWVATETLMAEEIDRTPTWQLSQ